MLSVTFQHSLGILAGLNSKLKSYHKEAGIDEGDTAHSFRSGCAITLALSGSSLADVISHVGWERSHTATYYMQLEIMPVLS